MSKRLSRLGGSAHRCRSTCRSPSAAFGTIALLVAAFGAAGRSLPAVDAWSKGESLAFGVVVPGVLGASYLTVRRLALREVRASSTVTAAVTPTTVI